MKSMLRNYVTGRSLFVLIFSFVFFNPIYAQSSSEDITILYQESFESGMNGWSAQNGVWEAGVPTSGPASVVDGEHVAGTILDGDYPSTATSRLVSPLLKLPAPSDAASLRLNVSHWYSLSSEDIGEVQVSVNNGPWVTLSGATLAGISGDWQELILPELNDFAELEIRIGFLFTAQDASSSSGWYIDRIQISEVKNTAEGSESFEGPVIGWTPEGGQWEFGEPKSGPLAAKNGNAVAGTVLGGSYADTDTTRLISPSIQIPAEINNERLKLRFWHWFNFGEGDTATLSLSENGGDFEPIGSAFRGESRVWTRYVVPDLLDYASPGSEIRLAFNLNTVASGSNRAGWYIDMIETTLIDQSTENTSSVVAGKVMEGLPFNSALSGAEWYTDNGIWELGRPSPESGFEDSDSTTIAGTVFNGTYPNEAESRLISPPIQIDTTSFSLELTHSFSLSENDRAYIQIKIEDGEWTNIADPFTLSSGTDTEFRIGDVSRISADSSLGSLEGKKVRLGFMLVSQKDGPTSTGWYIASIRVGEPEAAINVANEELEVPHSAVLHQNYPNPFNPTTTLSFELDRSAPVTLTVYDVLGRKVETLVDGTLGSGPHAYTWDAQSASSGVYVYRL
ncbi:MAG: T9SS type A sorting domain-containing protein, partial [Rhodothermaceae bacterium]|nr:T9SS type A sorting domain-containing protein [Rhodothermaceae bacterium]